MGTGSRTLDYGGCVRKLPTIISELSGGRTSGTDVRSTDLMRQGGLGVSRLDRVARTMRMRIFDLESLPKRKTSENSRYFLEIRVTECDWQTNFAEMLWLNVSLFP